MREKISVIVPVYRVEQYLDRCIHSIVNQTYSNLEIILVDDGSPDRCPQMCDAWSKKDSRIVVIHQENSGQAAARNAAMRVAKGRYFAFVDSDDWIVLNLCEKVMRIFAMYSADIVAFDAEKISESGRFLGGTERLEEGVLSPEKTLKALLCGDINHYVCNKIYKREIFRDIWFPEGKIFEDMAISYRLFANADRIYCLNERLYYYFQRSDSSTARMTAQNLCDLFLIRKKCYTDLKDTNPELGEIAYSYVPVCALRLYDRSLWELVNADVLKEALAFLKDNKGRILNSEHAAKFQLYFSLPTVYRILIIMKHSLGNLVRKIGYFVRCLKNTIGCGSD